MAKKLEEQSVLSESAHEGAKARQEAALSETIEETSEIAAHGLIGSFPEGALVGRATHAILDNLPRITPSPFV